MSRDFFFLIVNGAILIFVLSVVCFLLPSVVRHVLQHALSIRQLEICRCTIKGQLPKDIYVCPLFFLLFIILDSLIRILISLERSGLKLSAYSSL